MRSYLMNRVMPRKIVKTRIVEIRTRIPEEQYEALRQLVESGEYPSLGEAVRDAIRRLLEGRSNEKTHVRGG